MFDEIRSRLKDTVQVKVNSNELVPEINDDEGRFFLNFEDERYPCMPRAWESWANHILKSKDDQKWKPSAIRHFLAATKTSLANKVVKSWWEEHESKTWHIIKYKNTNRLGAIRYVGSTKYRLYSNADFLDALSYADLDNMEIRSQDLTEDYMIIRILDKNELVFKDKKIYSGFHVMNSENGCSGIVVKHLLYDLICSNGLMDIINTENMIKQRHSNFNQKDFQEKVISEAKKISEYRKQSEQFINQLNALSFDQKDAGLLLQRFKLTASVSDQFVDSIGEEIEHKISGWELISKITEKAQEYTWLTRIRLEEQAGSLAGLMPTWSNIGHVN